jgi:NADH-quinone oxidoreductase subunit M
VHPTSLLVFLPLVGAILVALLPEHRRGQAWHVALLHTVATFAVAVWVGARFDPTHGAVQMTERLPWDDGASLGVDAVAIPMVLMATGLFAVSTVAASTIRVRPRGYHAWMLVLESAVLTVFLARTWGLFYAAWEATLVPVFFLVSMWGGEGRRRAAMSMLVYTMFGAVFLLNGLVALYTALGVHHLHVDGEGVTTANLSVTVQTLLFAAFLVGFGVKLPVVGLHGWLPHAYTEAPTSTTMVLSAVLAKMAAVGLIRMSLLLPDGARVFAPVLFAIGAAGIAHGALMAWRERDLKRLVAWSSLSHMGFVLIGLSAGGAAGLTGAVAQMIAHGLVGALLFLAVGVLEARTHERDVRAFGGLARKAPEVGALVTVALLSSVAVPGTVGFVAEVGLVAAVWGHFGWLALAVPLAATAWAAVAIRVLLDVVGGPVGHATRELGALSRTERVAAGGLVVAVVALGVAPKWIGTPQTPPDGPAAAHSEVNHGRG